MHITKNIPLILNSALASSTSSDGSEFTVQLDPMLSIPNEAINVEVGLTQAEVYYSFKNISGGSNQFMRPSDHMPPQYLNK